MKRLTFLFVMFAIFHLGVFAQDRIAAFIENANLYAAVDLSDFQKRLRAEYNVQNRILDECYKYCSNDWGNVGMVLEIAKVTGRPPKEICDNYRRYKKNGWGRVLKEVGLSPNSNDYKKFYNRVDIHGKSWKRFHDAYCKHYPQYHKKNKYHEGKYNKPKKGKDKYDKKHGNRHSINKD